MGGREPDAKDVNIITGKPYSRMTGVEKVKHIGKIIVFLLSFGFVFPNILSD